MRVDIERTQAVQYFDYNGAGTGFGPDNSIPLIARKDLFLRVYLQPSFFDFIPTSGTDATATLSFNGLRYTPLNQRVRITPTFTSNRAVEGSTLNFYVPGYLCTGSITFSLHVRWSTTGFFLAPGSTTRRLVLTFDDVPEVRIHPVLVHYTGGRYDVPAPTIEQFRSTLRWASRAYPTPRFRYDAEETITYTGDLSREVEFSALLSTLFEMRRTERSDAIYVALLPQGFDRALTGYGGGGVAIAFTGHQETMAQEIGHAFGRNHVQCGSAAPPFDAEFPTYGSFDHGSIGEWGYHFREVGLVDPAITHDFMSYCGFRRWISPHNYIELRRQIVDFNGGAPGLGAPGAPARGSASSNRREHLMLRFRVRNGDVQLLPSFHLDVEPPRFDPGKFARLFVQLLDGSGEVLVTRRCRMRDMQRDLDHPDLEFHELLPWSVDAHAIAISRDGKLLATFPLGDPPAPPALSVRHDGTIAHLDWTPVPGRHYRLRYSHDGGNTWRSIIVSPKQASCEIDTKTLAGGEACKFQLLVSTGIRTAVVESEPFEVARKARHVEVFAGAESGFVRLECHATSPDFGMPDSDDIVWTSNIDGILGTGEELAATLRAGVHSITATVPDGLGQYATATIKLQG